MTMKGKLYALCEAGKPVEIDPLTLKTLEEDNLGGIQVLYVPMPVHLNECENELDTNSRRHTLEPVFSAARRRV